MPGFARQVLGHGHAKAARLRCRRIWRGFHVAEIRRQSKISQLNRHDAAAASANVPPITVERAAFMRLE
jgi:hypothetical protein